MPADHELFFSRARGKGLKGADVALVIGVPMDFRLGFGGSFGDDTQIVVIGSAPPERPHPREVAAELYGGVPAHARRPARGRRPAGPTAPAGSRTLRETENEKRAAEQEELQRRPRAAAPAARLRASWRQVLDRDAVVIGDGGDFVSYAGRVIDTYEPGCWMDPGPFGCLGAGPGLRAGGEARQPRPPGLPAARRRRLRLRRAGVRHARAPRRAGGRRDGQQRHLGAREAPDGVPLRLLGGGRAAARAAATTRWCEALGGHGELVERARTSCGRRWSARSRAGKPALVNVLTDPSVVYPRKAEPGLRKQNRPHHAGGSENGPIRTGRGTCLERALRFGRREAPIRCGFARTYVPDGHHTASRTANPTQREAL